MSEDEKDAGVSEKDAPAELTSVQAWADVSGQIDDQATTPDSEDAKPDAAVDEEAEEHAEEASSDDEHSGDGQQPTKQRNNTETEIKRLRGQVGGKDRRIRDLEKKIADEKRKRQEDAKNQGADPKDLDDLRESYPDLVEPILKDQADLRRRIDALSQSVDTVSELHETSLATGYEQELEVFRTERPQGLKIVQDNRDQFWEWVDNQPRNDRDLAYGSQDAIQDGAGMADLLNRFETHLGVDAAPNESDPKGSQSQRGTRPSSNARLSGARTVSGGAQKATAKPQSSETDADAIWRSITKA